MNRWIWQTLLLASLPLSTRAFSCVASMKAAKAERGSVSKPFLNLKAHHKENH